MTMQWDNDRATSPMNKDAVSPLPWEACGGVVRDADGVEVASIADWWSSRSYNNAELVARAVNCHEDLLAKLEQLVDILFLCNVGVLERQETAALITKARGERE